MKIIIGRSANITAIFLRSISAFQTAKSLTNFRCLCQCDQRRWNLSFYETKIQTRTLPRVLPLTSSFASLINVKNVDNKQMIARFSSESKNKANYEAKQEMSENTEIPAAPAKLNVFQKMKQLAKDYWHILIPVHIATSICWVAIFYVAAKNGVDVIGLMEYVHMPEQYINMIKNSGAGHWAVVYALYKVVTPLRYTVTVGGTTMSIRYLDRMGYLKFKLPSPKAKLSTKSNVPTKETNKSSKSMEQQKN